ncbi:MAG: prolyl oligopeptidase family serine peptidase [bacterium]|nr:prolyl oligopeptidase family serine peptidase [bacterium]
MLSVGSATTAFPRQHARTKGFTLGVPRSFTVSEDGRWVAFLRSNSGTDPINRLWVLDTSTGTETLLANPTELLANSSEANLPAAEQARRERAREAAGGIVAYAGTPNLDKIAFCLDGTVHIAQHHNGAKPPEVTIMADTQGAFDPRPSPDGTHLAYLQGASLIVIEAKANGQERLRITDNRSTVSWGAAEFIAAEEMGRSRGFWWSPNSAYLLAARVDTSQVPTWHIAYPATPEKQPLAVSYPAAGTTNAAVSLAIFGLDGSRTDIAWDHSNYEYLARASWAPRQRPTIAVQSRNQRTVVILEVDPTTGATQEIATLQNSNWVELVGGSPAWMGEQLVTVQDTATARSLFVQNKQATPDNLQVRSVIAANSQRVVFCASEDPKQTHVWQLSADGALEQLTSTPGVHTAAASTQTTVLARAAVPDQADQAAQESHNQENSENIVNVYTPTGGFSIASNAATPLLRPRPQFVTVGNRELQTAVLYPAQDTASATHPLPVLCDPYAGPHAQRVVHTRSSYLVSQWFANQGFAVVITDGRGTPARGPAWEQAVAGNLATPVLEDQIAALDALADQHPRLDLERVAIRGWSFGGYLAALAVLARPDRFACAIAGAPVTNWGLYDTHYTERYLGHPEDNPQAYRATNLCEMAPTLRRPLLLICGLADDNVFAAHTLQLSKALFESGRPHQVLPLPDVTHITPQEQVAENLLLAQRNFLFNSMGIS